jgi:hypothetical protein
VAAVAAAEPTLAAAAAAATAKLLALEAPPRQSSCAWSAAGCVCDAVLLDSSSKRVVCPAQWLVAGLQDGLQDGCLNC